MESNYSVKMLVSALVPIILFIVAAINNYLIKIGAPCINLGDQAVTDWVTNAVMYLSALYGWWKNNNVTKNAQTAQDVLNGLNDGLLLNKEDIEDE